MYNIEIFIEYHTILANHYPRNHGIAQKIRLAIGFSKRQSKMYFIPFRNHTWVTYFTMECFTFVNYLLLVRYIVAGTANKRRLCVDAVVDNYHSEAPVLHTHFIVTQHRCFILCMRLTQCHAFHFQHDDGRCELLPTTEYCLPQNITYGTTYTELNTCGQYPPRRAFLPPTYNWRWVSSTSDLSGALVMVHGSEVRYVSRVFERGLYLPGWWRPDSFGFRAVRPYRDYVGCGGDDKPGEFLILPVASYKWSSFTVGDTVPSDAVMGGYWLDLSPLYIVKKNFGAATCSGYFSTAMTKAYIFCSGKHNPSTMEMLRYS